MKRLLILVAATLSAAAGAVGTSSLIDAGSPPPQYRGDATVMVHFLSGPFTPQNNPCGVVPDGYTRRGCSTIGQPNMWLPNPCADEFAGEKFALYACHEKGHTLGWPRDHPR